MVWGQERSKEEEEFMEKKIGTIQVLYIYDKEERRDARVGGSERRMKIKWNKEKEK